MSLVFFNALRRTSAKHFILRRTFNQSHQLNNMNVLHNKEDKKFYIKLEKGEAILEYELDNKSIMDMYHTGVPDAYRGQGIAKYLVKEALQYAVDNTLKIKPSCSYVLKYVNDHPDPSYDVVQ